MVTWSENYLMGLEGFDNDHKRLFRRAEQIIDRIRDRDDEPHLRMFVIREGVTYLHNYFANHAVQEEAYMRRTGYDGYALHKMLHDDFRNIQLAKYKKIVDGSECRKEDVWDFIGTGIGWLLEHITTADMAIVGRGVLARSKQMSITDAILEKEINLLFAATLNIQVNAKIIRTDYAGENFGKAVCQKMIFHTSMGEISIISGIERSFMLKIAKMIYGDEIEDEIELLLSTLQIFSVNFWRTLAMRFAGNTGMIDVKESNFIVGGTLSEELQKITPTTSTLFTSDMGKFFVASNTVYSLS